MTLEILLALQLVAAAIGDPCTPVEEGAMTQAQRLLGRGDPAAARELLQLDGAAPDDCAALRIARLATAGWEEARALAPKGGAAELLPPVHKALDALQPLKASPAGVEAEYAETAIRAAIAAAQDERPEMELLLIHARDLSERLQLRGRRAVWPRSFNLLAGELWFEVDRYEDARLAFERAVAAEGAPAALVGLARAHARLGQTASACAIYRRAVDAAAPLVAAAQGDLARCR